jgi:hypothetical protein
MMVTTLVFEHGRLAFSQTDYAFCLLGAYPKVTETLLKILSSFHSIVFFQGILILVIDFIFNNYEPANQKNMHTMGFRLYLI